MELIFFALMLVVAAILFPEGTRAFVMFVVKAVVWVGIAASVLLVLVGLLKARGEESVPVQKVSIPATHHVAASFIVLDDGTRLDLMGGWYNADGDLVISDEEDAERVRLYREGLAAMQQ